MSRSALAAIGLVLGAAGVVADVLRVPGQFATVQEAIVAAMTGDEVVVAPGTYTERVDMLGKEITLRSEDPNDPDVVAATIFDGDPDGDPNTDPGALITMVGGETANTVIAGLTLTRSIGLPDKFGSRGGAIRTGSVAARIAKCVFRRNAADWGSAILGSGLRLERCRFVENEGIAVIGFVEAVGCEFAENHTGAFPTYSSRLVNCKFERNEVAAFLSLETGWFLDCVFTANHVAVDSENDGLQDTGPRLRGCRFSDNQIAVRMVGDAGKLVVEQCEIAGQAALYLQGCAAELNGVTLAGTYFIKSGGTARFSNCLLATDHGTPLFSMQHGDLVFRETLLITSSTRPYYAGPAPGSHLSVPRSYRWGSTASALWLRRMTAATAGSTFRARPISTRPPTTSTATCGWPPDRSPSTRATPACCRPTLSTWMATVTPPSRCRSTSKGISGASTIRGRPIAGRARRRRSMSGRTSLSAIRARATSTSIGWSTSVI